MWFKCGVCAQTYLLVCLFVCLCFRLSVPILATIVQEELETGSASSGDAVCAANTVKTNSRTYLTL